MLQRDAEEWCPRMQQRLLFRVAETGWGMCAVAGHGSGLVSSCLPERTRAAALEAVGVAGDAGPEVTVEVAEGEDEQLDAAVEGMVRHFAGEMVLPAVMLDLRQRSDFEAAVLRTCAQVAPGEVVTYGELAERAGHTGAARAVGQVMARNRLPLFVPCHRVVGSGGALVGFGGGLDLKARLLQWEGREVRRDEWGTWRVAM